MEVSQNSCLRWNFYFAMKAVAPSQARLKIDLMDLAKVGDSMISPMTSSGLSETTATLFS